MLRAAALTMTMTACAGLETREDCHRLALRQDDAETISKTLKTCLRLIDDEPPPVGPGKKGGVFGGDEVFFVLDDGVCRGTIFSWYGSGGTVTGCRARSSRFERVDGALVHACVTPEFASVMHTVSDEGDQVVLDGPERVTLYRTLAGCSQVAPKAPPDPSRARTCCRCLASASYGSTLACLWNTVDQCVARIESRREPAHEDVCVSFMCEYECRVGYENLWEVRPDRDG